MTALSWTRCTYLHSSLVEQLWTIWRLQPQQQSYINNIPISIPKSWKNMPMICNNIIRACPFCQRDYSICNKSGSLEHLHMFCSSEILVQARNHCRQKIETALQNLYNFASKREYDCSLQESNRHSTLQENLILAAKEAELLTRPVIRDGKLINEKRDNHVAILSRHQVLLLVLQHRLPPSTLTDYDSFPLMAQLGFIHAISEENFDIATATIIDVGFLGLFPKTILQAL